MSDTPRTERVGLARDYSEFLIELSIGLHKYSMYPSGHPSLEPAVAAVVARAAHLLADHAQVAFGVARRQLIIEGVATDPDHPVLRRLAEGLHRHHLGAVSILRGVSTVEVGEALRVLSQEPEQHGPFGLTQGERRPTWPHVRLHPLSFDGLALVGDVPLTTGKGNGPATRGAELWVGLARAAMASEASDEPLDEASTEPAAVAKAIDEHPSAEAYDQVVVGYLLQIARELKETAGADAGPLQRRTSRLIGALKPDTLRRLVEMGGDAAQRRAFVLDATKGMAVDAVLDIVKAAAEAGGQTISHGLVRMLSKLAAHAECGQTTARPAADFALREQVGQLLTGWELADPNPEGYGQLLQHVATTAAAEPAGSEGSAAAQPLNPVGLVQISLEVGDSGPMIERAIDRAVAQGRTADLLTMLSSPPDGSDLVASALRAHLVRPEVLRRFLQQSPLDFHSLDRLLPFMQAESYDVLLDVLATADSRTTRRRLLERLAEAPVDLCPTIGARLEDERWFVQRNMLVLLGRMGRVPKGFSPSVWISHPDIRVRYEAIRLQLAVPAERHIAVRAALEDGHPRLVHRGLAAIQHECPGSVADLVGRVALDTAADEELRLLATRALGRCLDDRALPPLLALVDGGRTFLGRRRLAAPSPVMLAALQALSIGWRSDARAAVFLKLAAHASDPEIRRAA